MEYLVDSDIVIDHLLNISQTTALIDTLADKGLAISIITYMETYQGILRSPHPEKARQQFDTFINAVPILPFSISTAQRCAALRQALQQAGKQVRKRVLDLMNAAIALEHNLTLVTRNVEDYQDIPDLQLYRISL